MKTAAAPYYSDVTRDPPKAHALWVTADDGMRLRLAIWPEGTKGTVLIFPGRTEYVEKYSDAATELHARGFASLAIDWRGQGLATRPDTPRLGHVARFAHYQRDVAAAVATARAQGLPEPYFLLGHSMGGCISLRAVLNGLPVAAAAFSAPMWGLKLPYHMRAGGWILSTLAVTLGLGERFSPGTHAVADPASAPFDGNLLTTDPTMFDWMKTQMATHPDLMLGGPSLSWLNEALREMHALAREAAPNLPCTTWLGTEEKIVDPDAIHIRMNAWTGGTLIEVPGAEHEVMMEGPAVRTALFDTCAALFEGA